MSFSSPLGALILVFALTAVLLIVLGVFTLYLSVRHRRRLAAGVYRRILASQPSASVLSVLTADDLLADPDLRADVSQIIVEDGQPDERRRGPREGPENGTSSLDLPPSPR
ncbi:MAG: hypothetical protein ABSB59_12600 [Streptosporangiaceae bacterium]|jgi:hypothetical protein